MNFLHPSVYLWLCLLATPIFAQGPQPQPAQCEEAWDYLEFLKGEIKDKIEIILQDVLFRPRPSLKDTVKETMSRTLQIRDTVLARVKAIRTNDGTVTICPDQNINQEGFLTTTRMDIMTVLLALIEKDAATTDKLQAVAQLLLDVRTSVNDMIAQLIMLRSNINIRKVIKGQCDCGLLPDIVKRLNDVISDPTPPTAKGVAKVSLLTMVLMDIDAENRNFYNLILAELDEAKRIAIQRKLLDHKDISNQLHAVISTKLVNLQNDPAATERVIKRDVVQIRNDADRLLKRCERDCPTVCTNCAAIFVVDLERRLKDYQELLDQSSPTDVDATKNSIRADLLNYLNTVSEKMTQLLTLKAQSNNNELPDECKKDELEVIGMVKGPLWMTVNVTIFGDKNRLTQMITALENTLKDLRNGYCGGVGTTTTSIVTDQCDHDEIETAKVWIADIDTVISNNLFKEKQDDAAKKEARRKTMLGFIDLKAAMDDRVRKLFQDNLQCNEEVNVIKKVYAIQLTKCLADLMDPKRKFNQLDRTVNCIKNLRVEMEERRGELLMREILQRITQI